MRVTDNYVFFWKGWLSNFWRAPFHDEETGISFFCNEQYFMYIKARTFGDTEMMEGILKTTSPQESRKLGQLVKGYSDEVWAPIREDVMFRCNLLKYQQNQGLKKMFVDVGQGRHFVEASPFDCIWAIGIPEDDDRCLDPRNWLGTNLLGKTLDRVWLAL